MTSVEMDMFSPSESVNLKGLLKNPEEDFQKVVSLLERKVIESNKVFKEIDEKYRSLIEGLTHVGIGIDIVTKEYKVLFQNQILKERFGDCRGNNCYKSYMGLKEPCEFCSMEEALKYNKVERTELDAADGRVYELISAPFPNQDGSIDKVAEVIIDITDRKRAEQELKESEEKYRYFIENSIEGVWVIDENAKTILVNSSMAKMLGYTTEEMIEKSLFTFMDKDSAEITKFHLEKRKKGISEERDAIMIRKDGSNVFLRIRATPIFNIEGNYEGSYAFLADITNPIKIEQALKESEEKYRVLTEQSLMGIFIMQDGRFKYINQAILDIIGYSVEEMLNWTGQDIGKTIHSDDLEKIMYNLSRSQEGDLDEFSSSIFRLITKSGKLKWVEEYNKKINYQGKPASLVTLIDITSKIESEQKLKESEEQFRTIAEQSFMGILIIQDGIFKYYNEQARNLNGYSDEEIQNWEPYEFSKLIHPDDKEFVIEQARKKESGDPDVVNHYQYRLIKKDGDIRWVENFSKTINYKGKTADFVMTFDITDKIKAENKIKESEENFRTIAEDSHLAITILQDDLVVYTNQKMADMFGYDREEMLNWTQKEYTKTVAEDSLESVMEQAQKKQFGEPDIIAQYPIHGVKSSGEKFWVDNISTTIMYNGRTADLVTLIDTTAKREAEQKLKESEEQFRTLTEQSFLGISILQNDIIKYVNKQLADMVGYKVEEIMKWGPGGFLNVIHPKDKQIVAEQAKKKQLGESDAITQYQFRAIKKNREMIWLELFSKTINYRGELADFVTIHDITDEKISEQRLKESEEKFRNIAEQSFMGIIIIQDGLFKYFNDRISEMNGYSTEEMKDWGPYEFLIAIYPEDQEFVREQARKKQVGDPDVIHQYRYRTKMKNGEIRWTQIFSKTITYEGRYADLAMVIDITDKIKAEKQLKESEEKFRKITEESLLAISIIQDDTIKYVNQEMANLYGYSVEEMLNWRPDELLKTVAEESLETVREQLIKKQTGDPDVIIHYPIQCIKKNGDLFWVDNLSKTMMFEGRPADLVTQIDITERIKAQQELIKLNQLKSELLRRTSHELKTPLVSIKGFSELLLEVHRDKLDALVISTINEIKQGCIRLETLIGDILKTAELESGIIELHKEEEDLSFLVKLCVNELKGFSKLRNHSINVELHEKLRTEFEKEQIHQVISNLLNNAIKYTPPGGLIEIKSDIGDNFIILSIKDNGIGFTEEEKTRIFTQFGKIERYGQGLDIIAEGSGFGLFISKKIIELHGGDIWVESEGRNKGSTFYMSLPLV